MLTTSSLPGTGPAWTTRPAHAARTAVPGGAARSTPRCAPRTNGAARAYENERATSPETGRSHRSARAEQGTASGARTAATRATAAVAMGRAVGSEVARIERTYGRIARGQPELRGSARSRHRFVTNDARPLPVNAGHPAHRPARPALAAIIAVNAGRPGSPRT